MIQGTALAMLRGTTSAWKMSTKKKYKSLWLQKRCFGENHDGWRPSVTMRTRPATKAVKIAHKLSRRAFWWKETKFLRYLKERHKCENWGLGLFENWDCFKIGTV